AIAAMLIPASVHVDESVAVSAALYYAASFTDAPRIMLTESPAIDLSSEATTRSNPDFDDIRLSIALWEIRTILGQEGTDRLVARALKTTRRGGKANAFSDALIRVSGGAANSVRDVLNRHELTPKGRG